MKTNQLLTKVFASAMFAGMMLFGSSVFAQVKIGTNPATIDAANNLEVESSAGNKVSVNKTTGKVTIADGSQAAGRVMTSDANGVSTWQPAPTQNVDVVLSVSLQAQSITANNQKLNFTNAIFDKSSNYNLVTDQFVAPTAGYYQVDVSINCQVLIPANTGRYSTLNVNGIQVRVLFNDQVEANNGYSAYGGALVKLNAGDIVEVIAGTVGGAYTISNGYLDISKISN